uniref:Ion transport domain-containing protein n=1 Tax=Timema shepardi TaxID=629360 RepID=A0A7R9BC70_TIMSH|nr:unnamed protein product [Timema shepardi]
MILKDGNSCYHIADEIHLSSYLKLVHIFSVNPHLGPLQISLGRMIIDILKFFFIYSLVLFAFGCGMNQLLWYYADLERARCFHLPGGLPDYSNEDKACAIWRRFSKYVLQVLPPSLLNIILCEHIVCVDDWFQTASNSCSHTTNHLLDTLSLSYLSRVEL